jgi:ubiquitin-like 1-activating enzyme E1 A
VSPIFVAWACLHSHPSYPSFPPTFDFPSHARSFLSSRSLPPDFLGGGAELSAMFACHGSPPPPAASAVFGGVLGQEVIKAISGKGKPAGNVLTYDAVTGQCGESRVPPKNK